jgi:hypothetical protein
MPGNITPGNTLVAVMYGGATSISGVKTGTSADTWASRAGGTNVTDLGVVAIWSSPGVTVSGQNTVVVTQGSSSVLGVFVYELPGNCVLDRVSTVKSQDDGAAPFSANSPGATTSAVEWWIGMVGGYDGGGSAATMATPPASPWVNQTIVNYTGATYTYLYTSYQATTSTGTPAYSGTTGITDGEHTYGSLIATFVQAATAITVDLPVAQVGVAAPAPSITVPIQVSLPVAQVAIAAPAPAVQLPITLALPVAQVAITAPPPAVMNGVVNIAQGRKHIRGILEPAAAGPAGGTIQKPFRP